MNKSTWLGVSLLVSGLLAQMPAFGVSDSVDVVLSDGSELSGKVVHVDSVSYTIDLFTTGVQVDVPFASLMSAQPFQGKVIQGKVYPPDPHSSMYLFAPSAYPIGAKQGYCRDFCVFFPSVNVGVGDLVSLQGGVFWTPGASPDQYPLILSGKVSFLQREKTAFATGAMVIRLPEILSQQLFLGFVFLTGTYGNRFDHVSVSAGWGFSSYDGQTDFMHRPILVAAGYSRVARNLSLLTENWFFPESDLQHGLYSAAVRFLGRKLAVDFGAMLPGLDDPKPVPLLNFTYHFQP